MIIFASMKLLQYILALLVLLSVMSCGRMPEQVRPQAMEEAQLQYDSAFQLLQDNQLNEAFPVLLKVAETLEVLPEDMTDEEQLLASRAYYQMAYVFRRKIVTNSEIDALRWALDYQRRVQDTTWIIRTSLELASAFSTLMEDDSARSYLDLVMPCLDTVSGDLDNYFSAQHVLADLYYSKHQFDSCFMVERNKIAFKARRGMSTVNDSVSLGICMYHSPYRLESKPYLLKVLEADYGDVERGAIMSLLEQIYEEEGNADSVAFCHGFNKRYAKAESDRVSDGMLAVKQYDQYKAERDVRLTELRKQKKTWNNMLIATALVLLIAIAFVSYYQSHKKRLREAHDTLKTKEMEALRMQVKAIYDGKHNNKFKRILDSFEGAYPDAMTKLRSEYPDLTETELDVLVLSFLGFRLKEVADILDLRENTVAKCRTSIRKKTGLEDFEHYLL